MNYKKIIIALVVLSAIIGLSGLSIADEEDGCIEDCDDGNQEPTVTPEPTPVPTTTPEVTSTPEHTPIPTIEPTPVPEVTSVKAPTETEYHGNGGAVFVFGRGDVDRYCWFKCQYEDNSSNRRAWYFMTQIARENGFWEYELGQYEAKYKIDCSTVVVDAVDRVKPN